MIHKAGFVNIIGKPNVGKSTLMNTLVGEKLSIITSKAQTTRHRIMGMVNGDDFQIVFSDTPGIIQPNYKMQESMMHFVTSSFADADIILFITDIYEKEHPKELIEKLNKVDISTFVVINKIDQTEEDQVKKLQDEWSSLLPKAKVLPISALKKTNTEDLLKRITTLLPESPAYYPKDQLTDKPERFFVSEIIREKILLLYKQEIPYSVEIVVHEFKDSKDIVRIKADILVNRKSQKPIIIGKSGSKIKELGIASRKDCEKFLEKQVHLELYVRVKEGWRENENLLDKLGY